MNTTFDDETPLETLIARLRSQDGHQRQAAAAALYKRDEPGKLISADALLETLSRGDTELRCSAAFILGEMQELVPIEPLLLATRDQQEDVRVAALRALDSVRERIPTEQLLVLLDDPSSSVRRAAFDLLGARAPVESVLSALRDPDMRADFWIGDLAAPLGEAMPIEPLEIMLRDENPEIRRVAAQACAYLGEHMPITSLVQTLGDAEADVRQTIVATLANQGARMPIAPLRALLKDPNRSVRDEAAKALGRIGDSDAIASIVADLRDEQEYARENTLSHLMSGLNADVASREIGQHLPIGVLIETLHDPWWPGGIMAAQLIGMLGDAAPLDALLALLADPQPQTRGAALDALGCLGARVPIEPVLAALNDENPEVRRSAAEALHSLGATVPAERLLPYLEDDNIHIACMLAKQGQPEGIAALVAALRSVHRTWNATCLLGELGALAPIEPLRAALGNSDLNVQTEAAAALYKTHPEALADIAPELVATLLDERVWPTLESARQTRIALALSAVKRPLPAIIARLTALLEWPYWETRMRAVGALASMGAVGSASVLHRLRALEHDPESVSVRVFAARAVEKLMPGGES